jgi:hypothetical protein
MAGTSLYTSLNGGTFFQSNVSYNGYTIFCEKKQDAIFIFVQTKNIPAIPLRPADGMTGIFSL